MNAIYAWEIFDLFIVRPRPAAPIGHPLNCNFSTKSDPKTAWQARGDGHATQPFH
jgi:hypothetical protein